MSGRDDLWRWRLLATFTVPKAGCYDAPPAPSEARLRPGSGPVLGETACASLAGETEKVSGIAAILRRENSLPNDAVQFADSFDQVIAWLADPTRR